MEFLDLFLVALMPVLKVLLVTAVGLFLATDSVDILGPHARNYLNNLVFYVFSPALIGGNLADTITLERLATLWFMPVNILLAFVMGSVLGWILVKITKTPQHLQGLIIGCCSAGNLGNLLLIILPAVWSDNNSPFGDSTTCSTYAEAYASLSMAVLAVYMWTYVYAIMQVSANSETKKEMTRNEGAVRSVENFEEPLQALPFPDAYSEPLLPSEDGWGLTTRNDSILEQEPDHKSKEWMMLEKVKEWFTECSRKMNLRFVFAPSTIAAILGSIIGMVSPIRKVMIGDSAPLRVIYTSASLLGGAAIPCITLIVGANLLRGLKGTRTDIGVILGVIAIRFILLPPIGIVVVKVGHHFGMVGSYSLYQFTLMLQFAVPPAMNIGTISQLLKAGESECSVIMLWTYAVASLFLTLWSAFFMWLVT